MHPYIAQIDDIVNNSSNLLRRLWNNYRLPMGTAMAGLGLGCLLMYWGFLFIAQIVFGFSLAGFVLPMVYFLANLPLYALEFLSPIAHREISQNTLHHQAVGWCEHDPSLTEVFAHLKQSFDNADNKTRRNLMILMLSWTAPKGLDDVFMTNEEAKRRFDILFPPTIAVEADTSMAWRSFSKKYLRI